VLARLASNPQEPSLGDEDFRFFAALIGRLSGISLTEKKRDLIAYRLKPQVDRLGLGSFAEYRQLLETAAPNDPALQTFINLLTTNKTDFFREPRHFEILAERVLPDLVRTRERARRVSVWCAASSTGEEAYSLAMVLRRNLPASFELDILASDIDTDVLAHARNGVYPAARAAEIPETYHGEYLRFGRDRASGWFKIADHLHQAIRFERHNLVASDAPARQPFDIIFCRNILIYFTPETVQEVARKMHRLLRDDGFLFIGHSESLGTGQELFRPMKSSVFAKIGKA
jgi:chemotaxis methyl-accepting protein methylase